MDATSTSKGAGSAEVAARRRRTDNMGRLLAVGDQVFVIRETLATLAVPRSLVSNHTGNRHVGHAGA